MPSNAPGLEQRVAALEALMKEPCLCAKCQPEPQPEPIDDDLVEAREICADGCNTSSSAIAYRTGQWDHTVSVKSVLAALKSRPQPRGEVVAWLYTYPNGKSYVAIDREPSCQRGQTAETTLYAHPDPRVAELEAEVAELVKAGDAQQNELIRMAERAIELEAQIAAMKAAGDGLAEYARHNIDCGFDIRHGYQSPCTCGLDEHKAAWSAAAAAIEAGQHKEKAGE